MNTCRGEVRTLQIWVTLRKTATLLKFNERHSRFLHFYSREKQSRRKPRADWSADHSAFPFFFWVERTTWQAAVTSSFYFLYSTLLSLPLSQQTSINFKLLIFSEERSSQMKIVFAKGEERWQTNQAPEQFAEQTLKTNIRVGHGKE